MFNIVDKDGDGRISFQEFLDTIVLFSKGRTDDKLRIIFDMCDDDKSGSIDKGKIFFKVVEGLPRYSKNPTIYNMIRWFAGPMQRALNCF